MPTSKSKTSRSNRGRALSKRANAARVLSIGYEGRTRDAFLEELLARGVKRLVDVRALPLSRKKGFSKTPLRGMLEEHGIEYVHCQAAGNPFREKKAASLPIYEAHLDEHPEIIAEFASHLLEDGITAVLCYERDDAVCHRSILLRATKEAGWNISVAR